MENIPELYQQGMDDQRIIFFAKLRDLILEKELKNDLLAAAVLGWAYERLGEN